MDEFEGANDFAYDNIFRVKSSSDLGMPDFIYELQWGIYESGVINISNIPNRYLSLYLATIYLYGDRIRPMSGDCDLTNLLIFVKGVVESKDQKLISAAIDYLDYLNSETTSNLASNYCYKVSQALILFSLKSASENKIGKLIVEIENYGFAVEDIVDVSFEDISWIEGMINSIRASLIGKPLWTLYEQKIKESLENNFRVSLDKV